MMSCKSARQISIQDSKYYPNCGQFTLLSTLKSKHLVHMHYLLALIILSTAPFVSDQQFTLESAGPAFACNQSIHFASPTKSLFSPGDDVYVKVLVSDPNYVSHVDLYIGKQHIGRDNTYPYEWAKPNTTGHEALRNMPVGSYSITAVVKDVCGKKKSRSKSFTVANPYLALNKLPDHLTLIRRMKARHHASKISEYTKGRSSIFKVQLCQNSLYTYWYDHTGNLLGKFLTKNNYQGPFAAARFRKVLSNSCHHRKG